MHGVGRSISRGGGGGVDYHRIRQIFDLGPGLDDVDLWVTMTTKVLFDAVVQNYTTTAVRDRESSFFYHRTVFVRSGGLIMFF